MCQSSALPGGRNTACHAGFVNSSSSTSTWTWTWIWTLSGFRRARGPRRSDIAPQCGCCETYIHTDTHLLTYIQTHIRRTRPSSTELDRGISYTRRAMQPASLGWRRERVGGIGFDRCRSSATSQHHHRGVWCAGDRLVPPTLRVDRNDDFPMRRCPPAHRGHERLEPRASSLRAGRRGQQHPACRGSPAAS